MRVLFLDQFSEMGGAQMCLRDVMEEARRRGWEAEILTPGEGPLAQFARDCGFGAARLSLGRYGNGSKSAGDFARYGLDALRARGEIRAAIRARGADLIYVNGPRALPAVLGIGRPVLFHAHSILHKAYARAAARWSLNGSRAAAIASSEFVAGPLRAALRGGRVRTVYNGVGDLGFRAGERPRGGTIHVGIAGRIAPEKGHLDFVQAARLLAGRREIRFSVIGGALFSGGAYESSVRAAAAGTGIEFEEWTSDMAGAMHGLDILAAPSAPAENTPRVIVEAFSAGTPVVAYPSGGIPELVRDRRNGWIVRESDPESLARAIAALAGDPALRTELAQNARRDWESRFTLPRFQRDVCDFAESFACGSRDASAGLRREPARA